MENEQKPKKKLYKRWWFWVICVVIGLIVIGSMGSKNSGSNNNNSGNTNTESVQQQAPAIKVTALQLSNEYKANQVAADGKYKGKTIEVSGTITSIGKDILDTPYISLNGGDIITSVQCMFDKSDQAQLATLSKDTKITLTGKVRGYLLNVLLDNCLIVQ